MLLRRRADFGDQFADMAAPRIVIGEAPVELRISRGLALARK
jgi:hypothetical protein